MSRLGKAPELATAAQGLWPVLRHADASQELGTLDAIAGPQAVWGKKEESEERRKVLGTEMQLVLPGKHKTYGS